MFRKRFRFLILCLMCISFSTSYSQLKVGVLTGLNSSKLFGLTPENAKYKSQAGLLVGLEIDYNITKNFILSVQPSFSQEGSKIFYSVNRQNDLVDSVKIKLNYLRIPLLAKIDFSNEHFYAIAGFDIGLPLSASALIKDGDEIDFSDDLNIFDFSMQFGVGYRWKFDYLSLFFEGRYTVGMQNISNSVVNDYGLTARLKNSSLRFLAGIEIPLFRPKNESFINE